MKTPAQQIKEIRLKAGLTQKDLTTLYGIPRRTVENWNSGVNNPPDYVANLLIDRIRADFLHEQADTKILSAPKETIYTDDRGKPLKEPLLSVAKEAFESGKIQHIPEHNHEGTAVNTTLGKLYIPTAADGDDIPFGFSFRVKEAVSK